MFRIMIINDTDKHVLGFQCRYASKLIPRSNSLTIYPHRQTLSHDFCYLVTEKEKLLILSQAGVGAFMLNKTKRRQIKLWLKNVGLPIKSKNIYRLLPFIYCILNSNINAGLVVKTPNDAGLYRTGIFQRASMKFAEARKKDTFTLKV